MSDPLSPTRHRFALGTLAGGAILILATLIAYVPAIRAGFIWDDPDYVTDNHTLRSLAGLEAMWLSPRSIPQYYPLVHTTFWVEYHLWGLKPLGYHLDNVLLHIASALLLWRLLCKLKIPGSFLAAGIFSLHPVHMESVAWVTERKNVLSGLLYLAAMSAALEAWGLSDDRLSTDNQQRPCWSYIACLALFILALLSKSVTCTLPAAILLIVWWKRGRLTCRDVFLTVPLFVVGLAMAANTSFLERQQVGAHGDEWGFSPIDRILIASRAIWFYVGKVLWPTKLSFVYTKWNIDPSNPFQWLAPIGIAVALAMLWSIRRQIGRGPFTAALFFVGSLVPALGFVNIFPMRYTFVADHYQYLASLGIIVPMAATIDVLLRRVVSPNPPPPLRTAVNLVVLLPLAVLTCRRATIYKDPLTLWTDTVEKNPDSWMVHTNLGQAMEANDNLAGALAEYRLSESLAPGIGETHWKLALFYAARGNADAAVNEFMEAKRLTPEYRSKYGDICYFLGSAREKEGKISEAAEEYKAAVAADPANAGAEFHLAMLLFKDQNYSGAIPHFQAAVRLRPGEAEGYAYLGWSLLYTNQADQAGAYFREALERDPSCELAQRGLRRLNTGE